jgi:hypothetical protein
LNEGAERDVYILQITFYSSYSSKSGHRFYVTVYQKQIYRRVAILPNGRLKKMYEVEMEWLPDWTWLYNLSLSPGRFCSQFRGYYAPEYTVIEPRLTKKGVHSVFRILPQCQAWQ